MNSLVKEGINIHVYALKVIADYTTPPSKEMSRDLESRLKPYIRYLTHHLCFLAMMPSCIACFPVFIHILFLRKSLQLSFPML